MKRKSLTHNLAAFFRANPGVWHDGVRVLAPIAGTYAWRTRLSEARRQLGLDIINRQRRVTTTDGRTFVVSEYCYRPPRPVTLLDVAEAQGEEATC